MKVYKCDRCGKGKVKGSLLLTQGLTVSKDFDLCAECLKSLKRWLRVKEEEREKDPEKERRKKMIECPYCHESHSVKLFFPIEHGWSSVLTTNPLCSEFECEAYACPVCGKVAVLDKPVAEKEG